ncbi:MAG: preprotein translocase subunit SecG [Lacibacter sp.]
MTILFIILILLSSLLLGFVVLVQNPKGGGLSGNIAGFSNQFMGVKQTTDVLEKGTWIFSALVGILCLISTLFISKTDSGSSENSIEQIPTSQPAQQPAKQSAPTLPTPASQP